ncbi:MAG: nucleotidyl transferase AbiEii/AbiGii toxin family protein [Candidatus Vogelbacteria bacterium]
MMIIPNRKDAIHKAWLYRILEAIADDRYLARVLFFKGGTCASMLGWLNRFSVDLDFDYAGDEKDIGKTRRTLEDLFARLSLTIKDKSKNGIQYFLRYGGNDLARKILKIDVSFPLFPISKYTPMRFLEIDRILICQTKETMFAHKLIAVMDRFKKTGTIAGRDIYDTHHFFMNGFEYDTDIIERKTGMKTKEFFSNLADFIEKEVTEKIISEDLNSLLPHDTFVAVRKILKREVLGLIKDEIKRLEQ